MGYTIDDSINGSDTYWGGTWQSVTPQADVQGRVSSYDVAGINVTTDGTSMTVTVIGPFFDSVGVPGRGYDGDLYISPTGWDVWNKTGDQPGFHNYPNDTFIADRNDHNNYEGWKYVVTAGYDIDHPAGVYVIDPSSIQWTANGTDFQGRSSQGWRGGYGAPVEGATVTFVNQNGDNSSMSFKFDDSFLGNIANMGLHWGEECGNDVVEGNVPLQVPEPGTILLLGLSVAGLGLYRRSAS
jgi:hypothetical protein